MDGKSLQVEGVQKPTELLVSQVLTKKKEQHKEKKQSKVVGWFTEKMEEKERTQEFKDVEDVAQWRSTYQEGIDNV